MLEKVKLEISRNFIAEFKKTRVSEYERGENRVKEIVYLFDIAKTRISLANSSTICQAYVAKSHTICKVKITNSKIIILAFKPKIIMFRCMTK